MTAEFELLLTNAECLFDLEVVRRQLAKNQNLVVNYIMKVEDILMPTF